MHRWNIAKLTEPKDFFKVLGNSEHLQIAVMNLQQGQTSGEYGTDHPQADQLLFVLAGAGEAKVSGESHELWPGDLILIEAGEDHQILGKSGELFQSVSFYSPMAYPDEARAFEN